ncbi:MAG: hypothetical protein ACRD0U_08955 [Acidimicrobiales bacterium]
MIGEAPPSTGRVFGLGLTFGALYVVALLLTAALSDHHVRPLFEGVGPAAPYRWVNPPPEFAVGNVPPAALDTTIALDAGGSIAGGGFATSDGQLVVPLGAGAIAPLEGASFVAVHVEPLDPATLGPLPSPLRPAGNVYQVTLTYQPTGQAVGPLAAPGNVVLVVPEPTEAVFVSPDGQAWSGIDSRPLGGPTVVGATFAQPGYYLAGTSAPPAGAGGDSGLGRWSTPLVAMVTAALGLLLAGAPAWYRRLRPANPPGNPPVIRPRKRRREP